MDLEQREENTGEVFNEDDGQMDLEQREENTGEVFNEDDGQMDLEQREENTGEVFNEDDGQMDLEQREENTGEVFNEDDGQMDLEQREENTGEVFNEDDGRFEDSALKSTRAKPKKERPGRMCVFCSKIIEGGKLKRHITSHKKTHEEVAAILKKPVEEQNKWFEEKRHEGIYKYNMHHLDDNDTKLMRERKPKTPDELRMCLACKKFFFQQNVLQTQRNL
nr:uncharacterized protein LOC117685768 isoform X2 [Crassostrea gigas]